MSTPGGYGAPPYTTTPDPSQQRRTIYENAPITDVQPTGEFVVTLKTPPRVQAGMAAKFSASFVHNIDGACGQANNPWTTGPVVVLLDGNAVAVLSSYATIGTVTQDQSAPGSYFSVIQLSASCPPGNYVVDWSGTYTPINDQEPDVPLPVKARFAFVVVSTQAPSAHYFEDTRYI